MKYLKILNYAVASLLIITALMDFGTGWNMKGAAALLVAFFLFANARNIKNKT